MQANNNSPGEQKLLLDSWVLIPRILDHHKDCTITTAWIYSYMLCKYQWFKSLNQEYFESQSEISTSARVSQFSVKQAVKYLREKGFLEVSKRQGAVHFINQYVVKDVYGVYNKIGKKVNTSTASTDMAVPKRLFIDELEDIDEPF